MKCFSVLILILVVCAGGETGSTAAAQGEMREFSRFRLQRLADGVFAAVSFEEGGGVSNAGIIDLGGKVLIFDTLFSREASLELRKAAESVSSSPVAYVVNSHYHNDHVWGNQHFSPHATIIASMWTREVLKERQEPARSEGMESLKTEVAELKKELSAGGPPLRMREIRMNIGYTQGYIDSVEQLRIVPPEIGFSGMMEISGDSRSVKLVAVPGSTPGDLFLFLPEEGIVFAGDLVFNGMHPYTNESEPELWIRSLEKILELEAQTVVPGHGEPGGKDRAEWMRTYLQTVMESVRKLGKGPVSEDDLKKISAPAPFNSWAYKEIFMGSVAFFHEKFQEKKRK